MIHTRSAYMAALAIVIYVCICFAASHAQGQQSDSGDAPPDPKKSYDIGVLAGSLLPSKVTGVREIVPGWSPSLSIPSSKGVFQFGSFLGRGKGITYYAYDVDYRMDMDLEGLPLHFYLGFHADQYFSPTVSRKYTGGWHFGGGVTQPLSGPWLLRADFRNRYGPGNTLEVLLGLVFRHKADGAN